LLDHACLGCKRPTALRRWAPKAMDRACHAADLRVYARNAESALMRPALQNRSCALCSADEIISGGS
jgi:hypothetical protein